MIFVRRRKLGHRDSESGPPHQLVSGGHFSALPTFQSHIAARSMSTIRSTAYGRCCFECSQAKLKCVFLGQNLSCERCARLGLSCVQPTRKRKRRGHGGGAPRSVERAAARTPTSTSNANSERHSPYTPPSLLEYVPQDNRSQTLLTAHIGDPTSSRLAFVNKKIIGVGIDDARANEYLSTFRTVHTAYFPFVNIPPGLSAKNLQISRPHLFLAVMTTGPLAIPQQLLLAEIFRNEIAQAMAVQSHKSVDLLLAILTYMQWFSHHARTETTGGLKSVLSLWSQMAISLVYDLNFNKPLSNDFCHPFGIKQIPVPERNLSLEEMRATLACFLVTSSISVYLQKIDALRWTDHMQCYMDELKNREECPGDALLLRAVRMQLVIEQASLHIWYESTLQGTTQPLVGTAYFTRSLDTDLVNAKKEHNIGLEHSCISLLHQHATELAVAEIALSCCNSGATLENYYRQKYLLAATEAAKNWLLAFFEFKPEEHVRFPFSLHAPIIRCMMFLLRNATSLELGDEAERTTEKTYLIQTLDRLIENLDRCIMTLGIVEGNDIYSRHRGFWVNTRNHWLPRLSSQPDITMDTQYVESSTTDDFLFQDLYGLDFLENWTV
ncbi:hypothetical protein K461DRAFT_69617 [Myriangium duriaei CBS 260.36]|uniref:Zn(2)-C6 fungal-type domain-containing protein n=1 Tax=Myriangium duriaei CBS 260.36 TaxID=1168546 RepID=A0A9P4IWJ5_9PEZI|nr:hypothetical protein K461DRAFT_69617 [Myriangium duriaei CBS 260.36]